MTASIDFQLILALGLMGISSAMYLALRSDDLQLAEIGRTVVLYLLLLPSMVLGFAICFIYWLKN